MRFLTLTIINIFLIFSSAEANVSLIIKKLIPRNGTEVDTTKIITSDYWSNEKTGPTSIMEAKKILSDRKNLDEIEGIWLEQGLGHLLIIKNDKYYNMFIIKTESKDDEIFNGTLEATIFSLEGNNYEFYSRVWYSDRNNKPVNYGTQKGKISISENKKLITKDFDSVSKEGVDMDGTLNKIWPL